MIQLDEKEAALVLMLVEKLLTADSAQGIIDTVIRNGVDASDLEAAFDTLALCGWENPLDIVDLGAV